MSESKNDGKEVDAQEKDWVLRLYVNGMSETSMAAFSNLKNICEQYVGGRYRIEIIDLQRNPQLAREHKIVAVPSLIRDLPNPIKQIVGDLSNRENVLVGLDIHEYEEDEQIGQ